jgi:hypothetical protein
MKLYIAISILLTIFLAIFTLFWLSGNRVIIGSGSVVTRSSPIADFTKIKMESPADLIVKKGSKLGVTINDYENKIDETYITNQDSTLIIATKAGNFVDYNSSTIITITTPGLLTDVEIDGSGEVVLDDPFSELQQINVIGSGGFKSIKIGYYNQLITTVKGSGSININGFTSLLNATMEGSGELDLKNLEAQKIFATLSGSGQMNLNVKESMDIKLTGSGNVNYVGEGKITQNIIGSGQVNKII